MTTHVVNVGLTGILFTGGFDAALHAAVVLASMNPFDPITITSAGRTLCTVPHSLCTRTAPPAAYRRPLGLAAPIADDCNTDEDDEPGILVARVAMNNAAEFFTAMGNAPGTGRRPRWYDRYDRPLSGVPKKPPGGVK